MMAYRCQHNEYSKFCGKCALIKARAAQKPAAPLPPPDDPTDAEREEYARTGRIGGSGKGPKWIPGPDWDNGPKGGER